MSGKHQRTLRNFLSVESGFRLRQIRRVVWVLLASVFISSVMLGVMYSNLMAEITELVASLQLLPSELALFSQRLPGVQQSVLWWFALVAGLNVLFAVFVGVYITQKLGGPLFHLKRSIRRIGDGDLTVDIHLRADDEFQDMAEALNRSVTQQQIMVLAINEGIEAIRQISEQVDAAQRAQLEIQLRNLESQLDYFQTVDLSVLDEQAQARD